MKVKKRVFSDDSSQSKDAEMARGLDSFDSHLQELDAFPSRQSQDIPTVPSFQSESMDQRIVQDEWKPKSKPKPKDGSVIVE